MFFKQVESITDSRKTVLFREWTDSPGSIIALFPLVPSPLQSGDCLAYDRFNGWGTADFLQVVEYSTRADFKDYEPVLKKIIQAGHQVKITTMSDLMESKREMDRTGSTWNMTFITTINTSITHEA